MGGGPSSRPAPGRGATAIARRSGDWQPHALVGLSRLHPQSRRNVRHAVDMLRDAPHLGRELGGDLAGFWRYPAGRLRVIYRFTRTTLRIDLVGPRATIYEDLAVLIRSRQINERRARYAAAHA